jgi:acetyl esterase/lipase
MSADWNRRNFLASLSAAAVFPPHRLLKSKPDEKVTKQTFTYKTVGDLDIQADVYRADDDVVRPVAIWIHGGALIVGSRGGVSRRVKDDLLGAGYALVSIDYRLAPETKLPALIEDVEDAYRWVSEKGPDLFGVDTNKIAVLGGSAGGYLTLTCGFRAKPRPAVLVSFWGYGDLIGDWYSKPSEFYRKQPLVSEEEAFKGVSGPPVANGSKNPRQRGRFYLYCRQNGLWPKLVSGFDPQGEADKFDPYMPLRNVTGDYPPTLLIHGTADTDVPYEQSVLMQRQFQKFDVPHELVTVPDAGHGLAGGDAKRIDAAYAKVLPFVERYARV